MLKYDVNLRRDFMSLLINSLYQQQLIAQRSDAIYNTMMANQGKMNMLTSFGSGGDILDLSTVHKAEQQLTFMGLINSLKAKIADVQLKALNKDK